MQNFAPISPPAARTPLVDEAADATGRPSDQTDERTETAMRALLRAALVLLFPILMGLSNSPAMDFAIPIGEYNIPLTLQTMWMALAAVLLGPKYGSAAMGLYLALGLVGFPMFSEGQTGIRVLFGQTCGYLFGFLLCQPAFARIATPRDPSLGGERRRPTAVRIVAGLLTAEAIVFGLGMAWLFGYLLVFTPETSVDPPSVDPLGTLRGVVTDGFLIFLPAEALKVGIVTVVAFATLDRSMNRLW